MTETRYKELRYMKMSSGWRFIDMTSHSTVGPHYRSEVELLADMDRYAGVFGCDGANQPVSHGGLSEDHKELAEDIRSHVWTTFDSRTEFGAEDIGRLAHVAEMAILDELVKLGYGRD